MKEEGNDVIRYNIWGDVVVKVLSKAVKASSLR